MIMFDHLARKLISTSVSFFFSFQMKKKNTNDFQSNKGPLIYFAKRYDLVQFFLLQQIVRVIFSSTFRLFLQS